MGPEKNYNVQWPSENHLEDLEVVLLLLLVIPSSASVQTA